MKWNQRKWLLVMLFGVNFFSYSKIIDVTDERSFLSALQQSNKGDEIVIKNSFDVTRGSNFLYIPGITIRSENNYDPKTLHIVGYTLKLTGSATFSDLNLSLVPSGTFEEGFVVVGGRGGPKETPSLILTNGNSLTLKNVDTTVKRGHENSRPVIQMGGDGGIDEISETLTIITKNAEKGKISEIKVGAIAN